MDEIKEYLQQQKFAYVHTLPPEHIDDIHKLFFGDITVAEPSSDMSAYYGTYYQIKKDYANAVKHYLIAMNSGNLKVLHSLAVCYHEQKDYDNAIKYWLWNIEHDDYLAHSMNSLGAHYSDDNNDLINAKKYFRMAAECGDSCAMNNLGNIYKYLDDKPNAFKYWTMAVDCCDYERVGSILLYCINNYLVQECAAFINKILNKQHNYEIIMTVVRFVDIMNVDMVNIIINLDMTCCLSYLDLSYREFCGFKKLLV